MNIKDPRIHAAAQELARRRGVSMTEAVRQAIDDALSAERARRGGMAEELMKIGARYRASGGVPLTDEEMYDSGGLPRW
jgi:antitoxin VapB